MQGFKQLKGVKVGDLRELAHSFARWPQGRQTLVVPRPSGPLVRWAKPLAAIAAPVRHLVATKSRPRPGASFAFGTNALLDGGDWPVCRGCDAALTLLFSLTEADHQAFTRARGSFVAMYCFTCMPRQPRDRGSIFLKVVQPTLSVARPGDDVAGAEPRALKLRTGWMQPSFSDSGFFESRPAVRQLFQAISEEEPDSVPLDLDEHVCAPERWGSYLGGFPCWDQDPSTPRCPRCKAPAQHLMQWHGDQFLDGALHIFVCDRTKKCHGVNQLLWCAEF